MSNIPRFGDLLKDRPLLLPGAANALTARIIEDAGFEAVYLTGAGITNSYLGLPDFGLITLTELCSHVERVRDVVEMAIVVDADTGFGNALNVARTVRVLERAGAGAIQIEDQTYPKRCGHFEDKTVVTVPEMVGKIHAAVDARANDSTLIIARTDALATDGFEEAMDRALSYLEAGADLLFIEAPLDEQQLVEIPRRVPALHVVNLVVGGKTPLLDLATLREANFAVALYANAALQAAIHSTTTIMKHLQNNGDLKDVIDHLAPWEIRQTLVRKSELEAAARRYDGTNLDRLGGRQ